MARTQHRSNRLSGYRRTAEIEIKTNRHKSGSLSAYLAAFTLIIIALLWLLQVVLLDTIFKTVKTGEIKAAAVELTRWLDDLNQLEATATKSRNVQRSLHYDLPHGRHQHRHAAYQHKKV